MTLFITPHCSLNVIVYHQSHILAKNSKLVFSSGTNNASCTSIFCILVLTSALIRVFFQAGYFCSSIICKTNSFYCGITQIGKYWAIVAVIMPTVVTFFCYFYSKYVCFREYISWFYRTSKIIKTCGSITSQLANYHRFLYPFLLVCPQCRRIFVSYYESTHQAIRHFMLNMGFQQSFTSGTFRLVNQFFHMSKWRLTVLNLFKLWWRNVQN